MPALRFQWRPLAVFAAALVLAGCGFHLRGSSPLPPELQRVSVNYHGGYNVLEPALKKAVVEQLRARGAEMVDRAHDDAATLNLLSLRQPSHSIVVGSEGQNQLYELTVGATYNLVKGEQTLVGPARVSASQQYTYTVSRLLSKNLERERLSEALQKRLAEQILVQLNARLSRHASDSP